MPKSLLEQLPEIVANGRKQAERISESLESRQRVRLQTREVVLPAKDSAAQDWGTQQQRIAQQNVFAPGQGSLLTSPQATLSAAPETQTPAPWADRLIYGDNLLAMAALLAGDEDTPSLRQGRLPHKGQLPRVEPEQKLPLNERFAHSSSNLLNRKNRLRRVKEAIKIAPDSQSINP